MKLTGDSTMHNPCLDVRLRENPYIIKLLRGLDGKTYRAIRHHGQYWFEIIAITHGTVLTYF